MLLASAVAGAGVVVAGAFERPAAATEGRVVDAGASPSRPRFVLEAQRGVFDPSIESSLLAGLLLGARESAVELLDESTVEAATRSRHACSRDEPAYHSCRERLLGLAGRFKVSLQFGPVPGTWTLAPVIYPAEGPARWLPTVPFTLGQDGELRSAVEQAAQALGRSLTTDGHRLPSRTVQSEGVDPTRLCDLVLSDGAFSAWETEQTMRAHLHRVGKDRSAREASAALKRALRPADGRCEQLAQLTEFQRQAIERNWLPSRISGESWTANIDILLAGPEARSPSAPVIADLLAGAFASRGVTPRYVGDLAEPCDARFEGCVSPFRIPEVNARLWCVVVEGLRWEAGRLEIRSTLFVPDGDGGIRAMALSPTPIAVSPSSGNDALELAVQRLLDAR